MRPVYHLCCCWLWGQWMIFVVVGCETGKSSLWLEVMRPANHLCCCWFKIAIFRPQCGKHLRSPLRYLTCQHLCAYTQIVHEHKVILQIYLWILKLSLPQEFPWRATYSWLATYAEHVLPLAPRKHPSCVCYFWKRTSQGVKSTNLCDVKGSLYQLLNGACLPL